MHKPHFDVNYLRSLMRRSDIFEYKLGTSEVEVTQRLAQSAEVLNAPSYLPSIATSKPVRTEMIFVPNRFEDKLFIRHLNIRLCRFYKPRFSNREQIVRQIGELLKADTPLRIARTDIRRFFRNIDFHSLIERFRVDGLLSSREILAIKSIAEQTAAAQTKGVPWGLSISSTLAEIFTRELDSHIRRTEGVYYYQRFVDDIIIFTSRPVSQMLAQLESRLKAMPTALKLNKHKTILVDEIANLGVPVSINYLGYIFRRTPKKRDRSEVKITISDKKIARYKDRIRLSIQQFKGDGNWTDLKSRLKLLTGNYKITKSSHSEVIKTGIYYNHPSVTDTKQLVELDKFLKRELIGLRSQRTRIGNYFGKTLLRELFKYSFVSGFENKVMHRFSRRQLERLFKAWQNVG